ncbi:hypothetical protein D3C87_1175430 [compost metagenome]
MRTLLRVLPGFVCLLSSQAWALDVRDLKGEKTTSFYSSRGVEEKCVVPQKWPGGYYTDKDRKNEGKLCAQDFYKTVGTCPKYNSTNPGILLIEPTAQYSVEAINRSNCDTDELGLKTESKFKQSISCSYTPSIIAYYHFSRLLGGAGRVPVSVIRTMDIATHRDLSIKANKAELEGTIDKTWSSFQSVHKNPRSFPKVVDQTLSQIYGAIVQNVKGEYIYSEVNGFGDYDTRYPRFKKQRPFLNVASSQSLTQIAGSSAFQKIAPLAVQMKDVSDMILLDTLLNQQDRIGNIHFKFVWYYQDASAPGAWLTEKSEAKVMIDKKTRVRRTVVPPAEQAAMDAKKAVLVKEMYLKDNDCGVAKDNMMRLNSVIEDVRHMSYKTYSHFMGLAKVIPLSVTRNYLYREFLYDEEDYENLVSNSERAKKVLYNNCKAGLLKFDVDLEDYTSGAPSSKKCDI